MRGSKKWLALMPDEKKPLQADYWREVFFLPPLKMFLAFLDNQKDKGKVQKPEIDEQEDSNEANVARLIEKLSEKEE